MNKKVYLWLGIMAFIYTFFTGCDKESNLTSNQEWEQEDPQKPQHQQEPQSLYNSESSGCLNKLFENWQTWSNQGQKYERIRIVTYGDEIRFFHFNTILNCAAEIKIDIYIEGDTIFINEKDTANMSANCMCPYRLTYSTIIKKDGVYNIKLNEEESFVFKYEQKSYNDTTVFIRPYEGPDFYEELAIWDFTCYNINFIVTDSKGNDLLDPDYTGNILKNNITITYNDKTFKSNDIELRYLPAEPLAIRKIYSEFLKKNLLAFGEFTPVENFKNETFTINWGDGTIDVVKFDLYIEWPNIYTPVINQKLYLNEKEVAIENYSFVINLIK